MSPVEYLKENTRKGMKLPALTEVFAEMSELPVKGESKLRFMSGADGMEGEEHFFLTFSREYEGKQLEMDVLYPLNERNYRLRADISEEDVEKGGFFRCVRSSRPYVTMQEEEPYKVQIFLDEP